MLWIGYRAARGKADIKRFGEYFGYALLKQRPKGKKLLWFHAASLGEVKGIYPIVYKLSEKFPELTILLTTTTVSGAEEAKKINPGRIIHQYMYVDCPQVVKRFFDSWQPDCVVFFESELWPNTLKHISKLKKTGIKAILLNGRMSPSSVKKWGYIKSLLVEMLKPFDLIIAASKRDVKNFSIFTAEQKIKYFGNIKYAINDLEIQDRNKKNSLLLNCNNRSVFLCASIHPGEGEIILKSYMELRHQIPKLLTIIVPRHVTYCYALAREIKMLNIKFALRSQTTEITNDTEIYLVDTFGELAGLYQFADVAFVGGSLIKHGGQNILEAAYAKVPVVIGPYYDNFANIVEEMLEGTDALNKQPGIIIVHNGKELAASVHLLLTNQEKRNQIITNSSKVLQNHNDVLIRTMEEIEKIIS